MKHYVSIQDLKRFLYIDFEENDEVLGDMIFAAEGIIEQRINRKFTELEDEEEQLPYPVLQAIKIMAGNLYANRESVSFNATPARIPYSFEYLIAPYIKYKKDTEEKDCKKHKHHHKHHSDNDSHFEHHRHGKKDSEENESSEENNDDYGNY